MKKILIVIGIIFLIALNFPIASASSQVTAINANTGTSGSGVNAVHPAGAIGLYSANSMTFQATYSGYLESVSIWVYKSGTSTPTFNFSCIVFNATSGLDDDPAGLTELEESINQVSVNGMSNSTVGTQLTFQFSETVYLTSSENYGFYVYVVPDTGSIPTWFYIKYNTGASGYAHEYHNGGWVDTTDLIYMVTVDTVAATPTPTPNPSDPPAELTDIWAMVGDLIGLLLPLLVILLPAFFGYKFAGAWGFLAGINVGAILAYVILGAATFPLWGIVAILILDALLLFGKVGFRT